MPPQCNTNSPPNLWESPLATAARLFSQLWSVPHPSFTGKSIPPRPGLVSQRKQDFDKWKSRCAVTWSRHSKSHARLCVFLQLWGAFAGVLSSTPLNICQIPLPRWQRRQNTPSETLLTQSWTLSRGWDRGRNQRRTFAKISARNHQRLTNGKHLSVGGLIISNRPPIWVCISTCGPLIVELYNCRTPPLSPKMGWNSQDVTKQSFKRDCTPLYTEETHWS